MSKEDLRWVPVRSGNRFCAPCCGGGCTIQQHNRAHKKARQLIAKLKGSGWAFRVHENLGWHHTVYLRTDHATLTVHDVEHDGKTTYSVLIAEGSHEGGCGRAEWSQSKWYADPNKAVSEAVKHVRRIVDAQSAGITGLEEALSK